MADLQEKSIELWRENAWELHGKLRTAEDRIIQLEDALKEILSLGDWGASPLARTVAMEALGTTYEQLKEGA
jgi:hypothetical protein